MSDKWLKVVISFFGSASKFLIGSWGPLYMTLILFQVLDVLTGVSTAWVNGEWTSKKSTFGAFKKAGQWVCIIVAKHLESNFLGAVPSIEVFGLELSFLAGVVTYFILTEALSLVENSSNMGTEIPMYIPKFIKKGLGKFNEEFSQEIEVVKGFENEEKEDSDIQK